MGDLLGAIISGIFKSVFGPLMGWWQKRQANNQAEAVSNEQTRLDQAAGTEAHELEATRERAVSSTGRDSSGELRDDSDAVQSAIDRANGKLP